MLDRLRNRAAQTLVENQYCTLSTTGPAGIQASQVRCAGEGITLYLLVPNTSDHLFNMEVEPEVAVTTSGWRLRGLAEIAATGADLFSTAEKRWHTLVKITPVQLHILPGSGSVNHAETIDFD